VVNIRGDIHRNPHGKQGALNDDKMIVLVKLPFIFATAPRLAGDNPNEYT
jgi:hypothetical protein